tara:strand:+ start:796 stop:1527 length:732 start_codon:yes stop_codon:yes gene_type:complete
MHSGKLRAFCKRITCIEEGKEAVEGYVKIIAGNTRRGSRIVASRIPLQEPGALETHLRGILDGAEGKQAWVEFMEAGENNRTDSVRLELVADDEPDIDPSNATAVLAQALVGTVQGLQTLLMSERELSNKLSIRLVDQSEITGRLMAHAEHAEDASSANGMGEMAKALVPVIAQVAVQQMGKTKAAPVTSEDTDKVTAACNALDLLVHLLQLEEAPQLLEDSRIQDRFNDLVSAYISLASSTS